LFNSVLLIGLLLFGFQPNVSYDNYCNVLIDNAKKFTTEGVILTDGCYLYPKTTENEFCIILGKEATEYLDEIYLKDYKSCKNELAEKRFEDLVQIEVDTQYIFYHISRIDKLEKQVISGEKQ